MIADADYHRELLRQKLIDFRRELSILFMHNPPSAFRQHRLGKVDFPDQVDKGAASN